ncbi:MAG: GNAT family N-acetyltransferase [Anaerolineae bacterium]|nr:GNAT family N-acetyltransferase [Anaerolineae bacterium]
MVQIREIAESDAANFLALCQQLDRETQFMLLEPDERVITPTEQQTYLAAILATDYHTIFVAENDGRLVGYLEAEGGVYRRNRHCAHIVIGILQTFAGQGIGVRLFAELEVWAHRQKIHRLELTVMAHNERAIRLYQKVGFEIEGTKRHSLYVNDAYVDEFYMVKLLP